MTGPADAPALRRLAESYALAADRRDGAQFARQFTQDGVLVAPRGTFTGRAELATVPALLDRYEATFHAVMNQVAEFYGETAAAETYSIARHFLRDGSGQRLCYEMTIRYLDGFRREAGEWLISRRELVTLATRTFPVDDEPRRGAKEAR